ncbi:hypothetical protein ONZ43_g2401 [Nemania bipapillata]|uniref:Uncharacterized protein n=1 Tax=Nemania bipapillata TaxID=110536 RepID=A0ACC2J0U1_9PEZI|nr:hypothetical protein ONZ43_g2401 [Nemania bipapillata]
MATTPRPSSPAQMPHTPERVAIDQSMMVEPPSQMEQSSQTQTPQNPAVRQNTQESPDSPSRTQILRIREAPNGGSPKAYQQRPRRAQTPETQKRRSDRSEMTSPGYLAPFDWEDFDDRYEKALQEADEKEKQMLEEFAQLVKYFNVWASAASTHDNERAAKRIQTRERFVTLSEQSLSQKKQHLAEVVKAFQNIESFHALHFSDRAIGLFESQFLRPDFAHTTDLCCHHYKQGEEEEEEEDGLGYYPDGVKRTLTDEQIAIFRHSELEAMRRAERLNLEPENTNNTKPGSDRASIEAIHTPMGNGGSLANSDAMDDAAEGSEDGEIETEKPVLTKAELRRQKKLRSRQRRRENQKFQPEKKPDLRKRTWDVVEAGMDSLHYDDLEMSHGHGSASATQRKQISYDD